MPGECFLNQPGRIVGPVALLPINLRLYGGFLNACPIDSIHSLSEVPALIACVRCSRPGSSPRNPGCSKATDGARVVARTPRFKESIRGTACPCSFRAGGTNGARRGCWGTDCTGPDPEEHLAEIRGYVRGGILWVQVGPDHVGFLQFYERETIRETRRLQSDPVMRF
jgi:hypothetical protein